MRAFLSVRVMVVLEARKTVMFFYIYVQHFVIICFMHMKLCYMFYWLLLICQCIFVLFLIFSNPRCHMYTLEKAQLS